MSEKRAGRIYWRTNSKGEARAFGDLEKIRSGKTLIEVTPTEEED